MNDDDAIDRSEVILAVRDNSSGNINCLEVLEVTSFTPWRPTGKSPPCTGKRGWGPRPPGSLAGLEGGSCGRAMATAMASGD